ncbi:hypothetical protein [Blastopirellula marina]|uniref:hypothetical protein n=1 Tax=Blastopirellula marina TaxID=124 RepID=UPI0011B0C9CD|nr:hypothetical protein [Blastopirellula marina]
MGTKALQDNWRPPTLLGQWIQGGIVFVVMVSIATVYQMTVVRWMEPNIATTGGTVDHIQTADFLDQQKQNLAHFFPTSSWQLGPTKVLESRNIMLLMKDIKQDGENRLRLEPLTIIAFATEEEPEKWTKPVVVLNAESAVLQFSELNLAFAKFGELVAGQLKGTVTINRKSIDGQHEPLDILTSDVLLDDSGIETRKDVQFYMGKHQGSGTHLMAEFEQGPKQQGSKGPNISGLSALELVHVHRILLSTEGRGLLGDAAEIPGQRETTNKMYASAPVEITCRGPFQFDGKNHVATFRDQVKVRRLVALGGPDRLDADILEVHFQDDKAEPTPEPIDEAPAEKEGMQKLKIQRLVAVGNPFVLNAPSVSATAEGWQLIYDLTQKRVEVVGRPTAVLTKDQHRVESPRLAYELGENPSHLGRVWSAGPGQFTGRMNQNNPQEVSRLSWQKEFRVEPQNGEYAIKIDGGASVSIDGKGQVDGDQLFVYLQDVTPPGEKKQKLLPHRLHGIGHIAIDSPQLVGRTNEIKTWFAFDTPQPVAPNEPGRLPPASGSSPAAPGNAPSPPANVPAAPVSTPLASGGQIPGPTPPATTAKEKNPTRFRLSGEAIEMVVSHDGQKSHLESATIKGQVQLAEIPEANQMVDPFMVRGNVVHLLHASDNNAEIYVTGLNQQQPAIISGRGLQLFSGQVRVNQRQGRIWTEGPGELIFPLDRDLQGRKLAVPEYYNVTWQGNLEAQHDQITFNRVVKIVGRQSQLKTAKLAITLNRPISFADGKSNGELSARRVECSGGVELYSRSMENGIVKAVNQFDGKTLSIDQVTGDIHAQGPGTAKAVMLGNFSGNIPGQPKPANPDEKSLTFVRVNFVSHLSGNVHRKEITFHKVDQAVYGPVQSWEQQIDPKTPASMNPSDVSLRCDRLTIVQLPESSELEGTEILAQGNSEVQGKMYNAWADRISYSTAKHMLTISGNGRNAAQLSYQQRIGGARQTATAGKIHYWPDTRAMELFDGKEVNISGIKTNNVDIPKIPGLR